MLASQKDLGIILSLVKDFEAPKAELEQYMTPSPIAAELLWTAFMDGNIKDKVVADFGCGTGILSIGASLLGAKEIWGYDIDKSAIEHAKKNMKAISGKGMLHGKINFEEKDVSLAEKRVDTVIMNPPFGVQMRKADKPFLLKAFKIAKAIYSIHKAGADKFLSKIAEENSFMAIKLAEREIVLRATMAFHEKKRYPVMAGIWKFFLK